MCASGFDSKYRDFERGDSSTLNVPLLLRLPLSESFRMLCFHYRLSQDVC